MRKIAALFCSFNILFLIASAQLQKGEIDIARLPVAKDHYLPEYTFDQPTDSAYDAWSADPSRDTRHTLWPAGDCFLVYPGGNSSLRLEKLREGITDFEKIRILKRLAAKSNDKKVKKLMDELNVLLQSFISEYDFNTEKIAADMDHGRMILAMLSDELSQ